MYTLDKIKLDIEKNINKALGKNLVQVPDLIFPPNPGFGDLSLPCFDISKKMGKTATETASWLVGKVETNEVLLSVKAVGPYLNFILNKNYLALNVLEEIGKEKGKYGENKSGGRKKVMIEYSNANTHKEYHVGHLRNICYGDAVNRILSANGYKSIPVSYINDFGIHVAKTLWYYMNYYLDGDGVSKELLEKEKNRNKGFLLGVCYAKSSKALEGNETARKLVTLLMKKIESREGVEYKLWQKTRKWSIEQLDRIYKELGVKFEHIFYENEVINKGLKEVSRLYKKEILTKREGAILADLDEYNLGVLVFLRSDGTALYPVADLALAKEKFKKYKLDKSIYVVDIRQSQYFKQLFKLLEIMGHKQEMKHLGYEFVKLPTGMMSSREGNIITYEDLRFEAMKKAVRETKKRHKSWNDKKVREVAGRIVNGAIKFEMIKVGAGQVITFDINKALQFEGYTAAYLQYTYARIQSIIRKSGIGNLGSGIENLEFVEKKEHELVMGLAKYPDVVLKAAENYDPSEVAKYLFELSRDFNDYYHSVPVLKAKREIREARLILISVVAQVIENGLGLLGIDVIKEM